jgi:hypothetical protein
VVALPVHPCITPILVHDSEISASYMHPDSDSERSSSGEHDDNLFVADACTNLDRAWSSTLTRAIPCPWLLYTADMPRQACHVCRRISRFPILQCVHCGQVYTGIFLRSLNKIVQPRIVWSRSLSTTYTGEFDGHMMRTTTRSCKFAQ